MGDAAFFARPPAGVGQMVGVRFLGAILGREVIRGMGFELKIGGCLLRGIGCRRG